MHMYQMWKDGSAVGVGCVSAPGCPPCPLANLAELAGLFPLPGEARRTPGHYHREDPPLDSGPQADGMQPDRCPEPWFSPTPGRREDLHMLRAYYHLVWGLCLLVDLAPPQSPGSRAGTMAQILIGGHVNGSDEVSLLSYAALTSIISQDGVPTAENRHGTLFPGQGAHLAIRHTDVRPSTLAPERDARAQTTETAGFSVLESSSVRVAVGESPPGLAGRTGRGVFVPPIADKVGARAPDYSLLSADPDEPPAHGAGHARLVAHRLIDMVHPLAATVWAALYASHGWGRESSQLHEHTGRRYFIPAGLPAPSQMNIVDLSGPGRVLGRNEVSRSILTAVVVLRAGGSCQARITYRPPNRASCVTEVVQEGAVYLFAFDKSYTVRTQPGESPHDFSGVAGHVRDGALTSFAAAPLPNGMSLVATPVMADGLVPGLRAGQAYNPDLPGQADDGTVLAIIEYGSSDSLPASSGWPVWRPDTLFAPGPVYRRVANDGRRFNCMGHGFDGAVSPLPRPPGVFPYDNANVVRGVGSFTLLDERRVGTGLLERDPRSIVEDVTLPNHARVSDLEAAFSAAQARGTALRDRNIPPLTADQADAAFVYGDVASAPPGYVPDGSIYGRPAV